MSRLWQGAKLSSSLLIAAILLAVGQTTFALAFVSPDSLSSRYEIRPDAGRTNHFLVTISVRRSFSSSLSFEIPAWTPGYYQILHFERGIDHVRAKDETGASLPISHASARVWTVSTAASKGRDVIVSYDLAANDKGLGFFGSMLDSRRKIGYVNGASAFMFVEGLTQAPAELSITLPPGWKTATTLTPVSTNTYSAVSYDEMIDSPIQIGEFESLSFRVASLPFRCVIAGDYHVNRAKVASSLSAIALEAISVFGSAPFQQYIFFFHIGESGFVGGLEHQSSTVIHLEEAIGDGEDDGFLTTCAHELFHAWNVKYLRPEGLGPFDYGHIVRTPSLWFAEGVTDYYADLLPTRAGLRTTEWFNQQMAQRIRLLDESSARHRVTLEQAGLHAWEGQSEGFGGLSYYLKGSLVGYYFDLRIREATHGDRSLDDAMRELSRQYASHMSAYPEVALPATFAKVAAIDLMPEYRNYVRGTVDIAWEDVFPAAGLILHRQADGYFGMSLGPEGAKQGTEAGREDGMDGTNEDAEQVAVVERIEPGSPAAHMNLRSGDRILAVDGRPVTYGVAGPLLRSLPGGAHVKITIGRGQSTLEAEGETGIQYSHHAIGVAPSSAQTPEMQRILSGLLASQPLQLSHRTGAAGSPDAH